MPTTTDTLSGSEMFLAGQQNICQEGRRGVDKTGGQKSMNHCRGEHCFLSIYAIFDLFPKQVSVPHSSIF